MVTDLLNFNDVEKPIVVFATWRFYAETPCDEEYGLTSEGGCSNILSFDSKTEFKEWLENEQVTAGESGGMTKFACTILKMEYFGEEEEE